MPYLELLKNHIAITQLPFSDRDSRWLIFQSPGQSRLHVKLAACQNEARKGVVQARVPGLGGVHA